MMFGEQVGTKPQPCGGDNDARVCQGLQLCNSSQGLRSLFGVRISLHVAVNFHNQTHGRPNLVEVGRWNKVC